MVEVLIFREKVLLALVIIIIFMSKFNVGFGVLHLSVEINIRSWNQSPINNQTQHGFHFFLTFFLQETFLVTFFKNALDYFLLAYFLWIIKNNILNYLKTILQNTNLLFKYEQIKKKNRNRPACACVLARTNFAYCLTPFFSSI